MTPGGPEEPLPDPLDDPEQEPLPDIPRRPSPEPLPV
jgi:hypothetical protein